MYFFKTLKNKYRELEQNMITKCHEIGCLFLLQQYKFCLGTGVELSATGSEYIRFQLDDTCTWNEEKKIQLINEIGKLIKHRHKGVGMISGLWSPLSLCK